MMRVLPWILLLGLAASPVAAAEPSLPSGEALSHYTRARMLEDGGDDAGALAEFMRVLALDPRAGSAARRASEVAARLGEHGRSLELADKALAIDSTDAHARWLKGTAEFNLGHGADALATLQRAAAADTLDAEIPRTLGRVAETLERIDVVAQAYRKVTEIEDDDAEAWFQLAAAEARLGQFAEADTAIQVAASLNSDRPGLLFLQGWIAESLGRDREAVDLYRRHLDAHSDDLTARRRIVRLLMSTGKIADAYAEAHKVSAARPRDAEALEVEAELAYRSGHASEGAALLERLRALDPAGLEGVARSAGVLARVQRGSEARAVVGEWSKQHPRDPHGLMILAELDADNAGGRAIEEAQQAVALAPDSLGPRVLLGRLHQRRKEWGEAARVWSEAWQRFPGETRLGLDLAFCREQSGQVDSAVKVARDVLSREPENPQALNFLGYLLADHNRDLEDARRLIARALDKEPGNGAFLDSMGWVYYRLGKLAQARGQLEKAVALTGDPVVHEHLGDVYKGLKLLDLARQQYRLSLAGDSLNSRVRGKLQGIR